MRFDAQCTGWEEPTEYTVTDAVFHSNRLSVDWVEEGEAGHLEVSSADGVTFRGHFGYPQPDPFRHAEFVLGRTASGELIFVGRWRNTEKETSGGWVFRLTPKTLAPTGDGDYTAERDQLFAGLTVGQIADAIRCDAGTPPPAEPGR